jgi:hypothetical protein
MCSSCVAKLIIDDPIAAPRLLACCYRLAAKYIVIVRLLALVEPRKQNREMNSNGRSTVVRANSSPSVREDPYEEFEKHRDVLLFVACMSLSTRRQRRFH